MTTAPRLNASVPETDPSPRTAGPIYGQWTDDVLYTLATTPPVPVDAFFSTHEPSGVDDTAVINNARAEAVALGAALLFSSGKTYYLDQWRHVSRLIAYARGATIIHNGSDKALWSSGESGTVSDAQWLGGRLVAKQSASHPTTDTVYITNTKRCRYLFEDIQSGDSADATHYAGYGIRGYGRLGSGSYANFIEAYIHGAVTRASLIDAWDASTSENYFNKNTLRLTAYRNGAGSDFQGGQGNDVWVDAETNDGFGLILNDKARDNQLLYWLEGNNGGSSNQQLSVPDPATGDANSLARNELVCVIDLAPTDAALRWFKKTSWGNNLAYGALVQFLNNATFRRATAFQQAWGVKLDADAQPRLYADAQGRLYAGNGTVTPATDWFRVNEAVAGTGVNVGPSTGVAWNAQGGLICKTVAGTPTDGSYFPAGMTPVNGAIGIDTAASKIWVRIGGTWKYAALT